MSSKSILDSGLSLIEFLDRYSWQVNSKLLTKEYLTARWRWMNNLASWEEVWEEYVKTNAYKQHYSHKTNVS